MPEGARRQRSLSRHSRSEAMYLASPRCSLAPPTSASTSTRPATSAVYRSANVPHVIATEGVPDQNMGPLDAGVTKRAAQLLRDADTRARHVAWITEACAGLIVSCTRPRPLRNHRLRDLSTQAPSLPSPSRIRLRASHSPCNRDSGGFRPPEPAFQAACRSRRPGRQLAVPAKLQQQTTQTNGRSIFMAGSLRSTQESTPPELHFRGRSPWRLVSAPRGHFADYPDHLSCRTRTCSRVRRYQRPDLR